ncbi:MAG: SUMF1/EgtB/PvdO family nonheme iron enzyme, partial [Treponema sp.]|nr:SUMF1/EgtB/PvdO family nonheme iron enzyme [Treponema sp.]
VSNNSYGFFYYAGHAVQYNGVNFLIPANAEIPSANFLGETAVSVQSMLAELNDAGNALNIVVLDSCRDFPAAWSRNVSRGLSVVANQPADSIIVFATSAGSVAADGTGRNGLFTTHLLTQLRTPGIEVAEMFRLTGSAVSTASARQQIPAVYNQFFGTAYLGSRPSGHTPPAPAPTPTPAPTPSEAVTVPADFVRIQGGTYMRGSPANETGRDADSESPQHQVTVSSFTMNQYLVTQGEWHRVMGTTIRQLAGSNPMVGEGDEYPMYYVSWFDAVEYCNRLSRREGLTPAYTITGSGDNRTVTWNRSANGYRLPTEAEWEYACRAGTATAYNTGNNITTSHANFDSTLNRTSAVGSYAPNAWGLYDMHGNVFEWCWDWYGGYPARAQNDPQGASSGSARVLRGGSWGSWAAYARSAYRFNFTPTHRGYGFGFRVVRN